MELQTPPGTLLLSVPQMLDPNFMHSVVLLCEHSEDGAYGLVVNRATDVTIDQLVPDHPVLSTATFPVFSGGPVGRDRLQFVHRVPDRIPGGVELATGLHVGGELDSLAELIAVDPRAADKVRVFLGYSGWGEGQLEAELATGAWLPAPLNLELVFRGSEPEAVWRHALRSLGGEGERLASLPPDVTWN